MYQLIKNARGIDNQFKQLKVDVPFVPTENQMRLLSAVRSALLNGCTYTTDVYEHVTQEMKDMLTPEILASGKDRVEYGDFGMDIYYARYYVESCLVRSSNVQALNKLLANGEVYVGMKMKDFHYSGHVFSTSIITSMDVTSGKIEIESKRRGVKGFYKIGIGANATPFLSCLREHIKTKNFVDSVKDGIRTLTIDLGQDRLSEMSCQL